MNAYSYVPIFYERNVRGYAHLLDTLNGVIGPIEKILETLEKKFQLKFHVLPSYFQNRTIYQIGRKISSRLVHMENVSIAFSDMEKGHQVLLMIETDPYEFNVSPELQKVFKIDDLKFADVVPRVKDPDLRKFLLLCPSYQVPKIEEILYPVVAQMQFSDVEDEVKDALDKYRSE